MRSYLAVIITIMLLLPGQVRSELKNVTLDECIGIAVQSHPDIMASDEDTDIARANYGMAKSRRSPNINLELKTIESRIVDEEGDVKKPKNGLVGIPGRDTMIGLFVGPTAIYNLYDPQRSETIDSAKFGVDLSKMKALKTKSEIIFNVKKNYYGYLFARENRAKLEQLVETNKSKLEKAKQLVENGQRSVLDITKSDVDLADAMLEYEKAKNYENIIKTELLASMGILDEDIEFSPVKVDKLPELRFPLKMIYQLAESNNPDMKIARMNREISRLNVSAARSAHYPYVDLLASIGMENTKIIHNWENPWKYPEVYQERLKSENWSQSVNIGISAKVSLWSGGGLESKVDARIAEFNKSKYLEREAFINVRKLIKNYFQNINEFKKQIELSELVYNNSQKHLKYAQKSYDKGQSTQFELQDAEMTLLKSELGSIKVRYDYMITLARLSNLVGLDEEYICVK
jgi:outer membrane protein